MSRHIIEATGDTGLQPERTALSWSRTALAIAVNALLSIRAGFVAGEPWLVLICGRYEGTDERAREALGTEEVSIGDYVLTGGELPAMVVIDSVVRLQPGALGHGVDAVADDSHTSGLLQYPQYTRPAEYRGWTVPEVLLSGHHANIEKWKREQRLERTRERRPDLLGKDE